MIKGETDSCLFYQLIRTRSSENGLFFGHFLPKTSLVQNGWLVYN